MTDRPTPAQVIARAICSDIDDGDTVVAALRAEGYQIVSNRSGAETTIPAGMVPCDNPRCDWGRGGPPWCDRCDGGYIADVSTNQDA